LGEVDLKKLILSHECGNYTDEQAEKGTDLIKKCLKWAPSDRISANEAL